MIQPISGVEGAGDPGSRVPPYPVCLNSHEPGSLRLLFPSARSLISKAGVFISPRDTLNESAHWPPAT